MKKLRKIKLHDAVVLENREMKMIFGGSGSSSEACAYSTTIHGPAVCCINCTPAQTEFMAGSGGWWGCNSPEAYKACSR